MDSDAALTGAETRYVDISSIVKRHQTCTLQLPTVALCLFPEDRQRLLFSRAARSCQNEHNMNMNPACSNAALNCGESWWSTTSNGDLAVGSGGSAERALYQALCLCLCLVRPSPTYPLPDPVSKSPTKLRTFHCHCLHETVRPTNVLPIPIRMIAGAR